VASATHRETSPRRENPADTETASHRKSAGRRGILAGLAVRVRCGAPALLALRIAIAAAFAAAGAQPAVGGLAAGALT
jgi:hypothetical protein